MNNKAWIDSGGGTCPHCGSERIRERFLMFEVEPGVLRMPHRCLDCSETWWLYLNVWSWEPMTEAEYKKFLADGEEAA